MEDQLQLTEYQIALIEELKHVLKISNYKKTNEKIEAEIVKILNKH